LPTFKREELTEFVSQLREAAPEKPQDVRPAAHVQDLIISVPQSEYVKAGYFGMKSYTIYKIESRVERKCKCGSRI
jgi:hypothetical protein